MSEAEAKAKRKRDTGTCYVCQVNGDVLKPIAQTKDKITGRASIKQLNADGTFAVVRVLCVIDQTVETVQQVTANERATTAPVA